MRIPAASVCFEHVLARILGAIIGGSVVAGCGLLASVDACELTLSQVHDRPAAQERELLEPPYRLAMTSVDQNNANRRVAWLEITSDEAWGQTGERLNFVYTEPGAPANPGHTAVDALDYESGGGLGYVMSVPGRYELRLTSRACALRPSTGRVVAPKFDDLAIPAASAA